MAAIDIDEGHLAFCGGDAHELFDRLRRSPHRKEIHPFLVNRENTTAGFVVLREGSALPVWAPSDVVTLHNLRIGNRFRRQGYGQAAVQTAGRWIAAQRPIVTTVMLSVNLDNEAAIALYLSCGFAPTGAMVSGRIGPECLMQAEISTILGRAPT